MARRGAGQAGPQRGAARGAAPCSSAALERGAAAPSGVAPSQVTGRGPRATCLAAPGSRKQRWARGSPRFTPPPPPRAWLGARPLPGASGKCEKPPPLRGCQGKHGPAQTLCQWVGGAAPGRRAGAENETPPTPSPGPGIGHLPPRLAQAACFAPLSSVPLTVHLHPRRGYRPSRLRASKGRRGEPSELPRPPRRCYRPPTPSRPACPLGPRFAIAAAFCHCLPPCSRCFSLPACSEATPTVRSHSPLAAGPRAGPGGGRGLIRAGGVAGRIGWSSRPAAAACRGHC